MAHNPTLCCTDALAVVETPRRGVSTGLGRGPGAHPAAGDPDPRPDRSPKRSLAIAHIKSLPRGRE